MFYYNGEESNEQNTLYNKVFENVENANKFTIITGYIGPYIIHDLIKLSGYYDEINVIVGMYGEKFTTGLRKSINNLISKETNINIYYTRCEVHTKCYIWSQDDEYKKVILGSANFSINGLRDNPYREILCEANGLSGDSKYKQYIEYVMKHKVLCDTNWSENNKIQVRKEIKEKSSCKLSLLSTKDGSRNILGIKGKRGEVQVAAGLNWGFSYGLPKLGDAYIPISKTDIYNSSVIEKKYKYENKDGKSKSPNMPFECVWDDGTSMCLLFEGNGIKKDEELYPKQISTYNNKNLLGQYLRKRISDKTGLDLEINEKEIEVIKKIKDEYQISRKKWVEQYDKLPEQEKKAKNKSETIECIKKEYIQKMKELYDWTGQEEKNSLFDTLSKKIITKEILEKYGRTDITIMRDTEGIYSLDFSVEDNK